jgi:hypothetical protein
MSIIDSVFEVSAEFMKNPKFVRVQHGGLKILAEKMEEEGKVDFFKNKNIEEYERDLNFDHEIKLELLANSINYCFWHGGPHIKPKNLSSTLMYALLVDSYSKNNRRMDTNLINLYTSSLAEYRFPLLEEREKHLKETIERWSAFTENVNENREDVGPLVDEMVKTFPGYASDLFLKRTSLFFIQLNRKFGWFRDSINVLPVPADYQVPKILRSHGMITYVPRLANLVDNYVLIPKGSLMECEIRAATVQVCAELGKLLDWSPVEVDTWIWTKRKEDQSPFHLTITTHY